MDHQYWYDRYEECTDAFLNLAEQCIQKISGSELHSITLSNDLQIPTLLVPGKPGSPLMILVSGIHGIEGFAGSALQLATLEKRLEGNFENITILMVHGVNALGFRNGRRVTDGNVDLNRNALLNPSDFGIQNKDYFLFQKLVEPEGKARKGFLSAMSFFLTFLPLYIRHGNDRMVRAIMSGQYESPGGILYGGQELDPGLEAVISHIDRVTDAYPFTLLIDIHTGYGSRGELHLFPNAEKDIEKIQRIERLFKGHPILWGGTGNFYSVTGDFARTTQDLSNGKKEIASMVFEFGTSDNDRLPGSYLTLYTSVRENQGRKLGYARPGDREWYEKKYREMFYPDSSEWKQRVIDRGLGMLFSVEAEMASR